MDSPAPDNLDRLIAYVEGQLSADEQARFEQELAGSSRLRGQLDLLRRIDRSMVEQLAPRGEVRVEPGVPALKGTNWRRWTGLAGAAVAASILLAMAWLYVAAPGRPQRLTLSALYHSHVAGGFVPDWVCKDDAEFIDTTRKAFGVPLLAKTEGDVEIIGWSGYGDRLADLGLSPAAREILARVKGREVIVLIDKPAPARPPKVDSTSLNLFERRIGDVALYEITPLDRPAAIDRFVLTPG